MSKKRQEVRFVWPLKLSACFLPLKTAIEIRDFLTKYIDDYE